MTDETVIDWPATRGAMLESDRGQDSLREMMDRGIGQHVAEQTLCELFVEDVANEYRSLARQLRRENLGLWRLLHASCQRIADNANAQFPELPPAKASDVMRQLLILVPFEMQKHGG